MARKEREKARHRLEILEAAEKVFARKGFRGATIEEIAQQAEFSVGTLYNFFESKEELYAAVLVERVQQFQRLVENIFSRPEVDPVRLMEEFIERKAGFFAEHAPFFRLLHREHVAGSADISASWRRRLLEVYQQFIARLEGAIRRGIETGRLRDMPPRDTALALQGLTDSLLMECLNTDVDYRSKVGLMKSLFFEGALKRPESDHG